MSHDVKIMDLQGGFLGHVYNVTRMTEDDLCVFFHRDLVMVAGFAKAYITHDFPAPTSSELGQDEGAVSSVAVPNNQEAL